MSLPALTGAETHQVRGIQDAVRAVMPHPRHVLCTYQAVVGVDALLGVYYETVQVITVPTIGLCLKLTCGLVSC